MSSRLRRMTPNPSPGEADPEDLEGRRILVIQTAFLGDLVLTLPLLAALHRRAPTARIHVLAHASYASLLEGYPGVTAVLPYDKRGRDAGPAGMARVIAKLRRWGCETALLPHRSTRSALLALLSGARRRIGFEGTPGAWLYTVTVPRREEAHEGARNLDLLPPLGIRGEPARPILPPHPAAGEAESFLARHDIRGASFVAFAPGSVWPTKRWPWEHWMTLAAELSRDYDLPVVLVGGEMDRSLCEAVAGRAGGKVVSAAGRLGIPASAELLRRARLLITGDSAPLHLAQAVDTPTLALFGPTVPEFGFGPTGPGDRVIGLDLPCRPCAIHGGRKCPLGHHDCMKKLSPALVRRAAGDMLTGNLQGSPR